MLVGAAWPATAAVAALVLGRVIGRADALAADATTPNFAVDGSMAHEWPGRMFPPAESPA